MEREPVPDAELDELYAAPVEEFTPRRNELVRALRERGDKEAAQHVKALKRPTLTAWALNQVARRDPDGIRDLCEVQDSMLEVSDAEELRELSRKRRGTVNRLVEGARDILAEGDRSAGPQALEKVRRALLAATSPEARDLLSKGRLEREPSEAGFDQVFAEMPPVPEAPAPSARDRDLVKRAEELEDAARAAIQQAADLRRRAQRLQRQAEVAAAEAAAAERRAREAEESAEKARAKL